MKAVAGALEEAVEELPEDPALAKFESIRSFLAGGAASALEHFELETYMKTEGFELLRLLLQDHLDLRATKEVRLSEVTDASGSNRPFAELNHARTLSTIVGTVRVGRLAYRRKGHENLHVADAALNLPAERYSHGLRELTAIESARGSFEEAGAAIERSCGQRVPKRQLEALAQAAAKDVDAFYDAAARPVAHETEVVVLSADGKGIVMRHDALRPATARAAARSTPKIKSRLSKGEKKDRKRMAELGTVYSVVPVPRTPSEVMARSEDGQAKQAPKAKDKWLTASVVEDASVVIASLFDEAARRDPTRRCDWVALLDGNNHQIDRINAEAKARGIEVPIVVDFIHVLEYLWKSGWSFFEEGDEAAEAFVAEKALAVLEGNASSVAAAIRRKATMLGLDPQKRKNADLCADYLLAKAPYLDYPTALEKGWPIATGVIEGACRHLVKDRLDLTGARWGLEGAEAVMKLRALRSNGDWESYWSFHLSEERQRVHNSRYLDNVIPTAA
jgi:hypothetical protein